MGGRGNFWTSQRLKSTLQEKNPLLKVGFSLNCFLCFCFLDPSPGHRGPTIALLATDLPCVGSYRTLQRFGALFARKWDLRIYSLRRSDHRLENDFPFNIADYFPPFLHVSLFSIFTRVLPLYSYAKIIFMVQAHVTLSFPFVMWKSFYLLAICNMRSLLHSEQLSSERKLNFLVNRP